MKKFVLSTLLGLFLMLTFGFSTLVKAQAPVFRVNFTVQIKPGVTVDMGANVVVNPNKPKKGSTILILNGTGQNSNTFIPLSQQLFTDSTTSKLVARTILLNYPGHGNSSFPQGAKFGDLTLSDYVTSLIESLKNLNAIGMAPDVIMGHSLGSEMLHLAQQRLISQGTNFRKAFGVKTAIFFVPDIVGPPAWGFTDSGTGAAVLSMLRVQDPQQGSIVVFPPPVWIGFFYGNLMGQVVQGAPTPDQAVANGFITTDSATMAAEFLGAPPFKRPTVSAGIFGNSQGTTAGLVALEQDGIYTIKEHQDLYTHLTQDQSGKLFFPLRGPNTVHNLHVFSPASVIDPIKQILMAGKKNK